MKPLLFTFILTLLFSCETETIQKFQYVYTGQPLKYDIYFGNKLQGSQSMMVNEDGSLDCTFEFNDRGRGPKYEENITLDIEGRIIQHKIEGNNYLKDTVNELFTVDGRKASWNSTSESGFTEYHGQHYANMDGSFMSGEILARRMRNSEDNSIDLLPSGKAYLTTDKEFNLGDSLKLSLVGISGMGFTPNYFWVDVNGRFFASLSDWFSCIRAGHNNLKEDLWKLQKDVEDQFFTELTKKLENPTDSPIAIINTSLFNPESKSLDKSVDIIIDGNVIKEVGPSSTLDIPENAKRIDGQGKTCLPGLFDMHVHYGKSDGMLHLACGVTSVRDLANSLTVREIKEDIDNGNLLGPRIVVLAGFVDGAGPYAGPTGVIIENIQEGIDGITEYANLGYTHIKLYSSIKPEWVKPLIDHAKKLDMRVSGHIPAFMTASQAIDEGYDEIQHINMILLNFLSDTIDTRTPQRFTSVAENSYLLELAGNDFKKFINQLKRENIVVDPTVSIFEGMFKGIAGKPNPSYAMILDRLPIQAQREMMQGGLPGAKENPEIYAASYQKMLDAVKALYDGGVTIVPGTDALVGFTLHRELELYVSTGIPSAEVLTMATLTSAKVAGVSDKLGSIEKGKLADLIIVDGNPVKEISDIRNINLTIKNGIIYDPEKLFKSVGVKGKHKK